jgi:hypothetical protein
MYRYYAMDDIDTGTKRIQSGYHLSSYQNNGQVIATNVDTWYRAQS